MLSRQETGEPKAADALRVMPTRSDLITDQATFISSSLKDMPLAGPAFSSPYLASAPNGSNGSSLLRTMLPFVREATDRHTLVVGHGISVHGSLKDAERLVVEGMVEAKTIDGLVELAIFPNGVFRGEVEVEIADVAGTIEGTLTARSTLIVRSTGRVLGTVHCRRLQVEDGAQISGHLEMIPDKAG